MTLVLLRIFMYNQSVPFAMNMALIADMALNLQHPLVPMFPWYHNVGYFAVYIFSLDLLYCKLPKYCAGVNF